MRFRSHTIAAANSVSTETYRHKTMAHAKKQKLLRASRDVNPPKKNARALVKDVIVIDGPAWVIPMMKRF